MNISHLQGGACCNPDPDHLGNCTTDPLPEDVEVVVLDSSAYRWIVADYRNHGDGWWWCLHGASVSWPNVMRTIRRMDRWEGRGPDVTSRMVFQAQNRGQVADYILTVMEQTVSFGGRYLNPKEGTDRMRLHDRREVLERNMQRLEREMAFLDSLPEEPDVEPAVIYFVKTFGGRHEYTYAAVKAGDGLWYTSGPQTPKGYTWDQLVRWMYDDDDDMEVWVADTFDALV